MIRLCVTLAVLAVVLAPAARAQGQEQVTLWEAIPFAPIVRADLGLLDDATLMVRAESLRQRLFIDEQTIAIERGEDLELVVGYAAAVALLAERRPALGGLSGARRTAAYLLYATGHQCETRPELRVAVAELGAIDDPAARALAASVKAMKRYGKARFERLLALEILERDGLGPTALAQAGVVALAEGHTIIAAERFVAAATHQALPRFAVAACEALLLLGEPEGESLCGQLRARYVEAFPATAPRFDEVRRGVRDRLALKRFDGAPEVERSASPEELAAAAWRRLRQGRSGAARRLARVLRERFPLTLAAWHTGAEIAVADGQLGEVEAILAEADRQQVPRDARLEAAHLAALVNRALDRALVSRRGLRPERQRALQTALEAWAARGPPRKRLLQLRVLVALAEHLSRQAGAEERLVRAADALAGEAALDPVSARLLLLTELVRERWTDPARVLSALEDPARPEIASLIARIELGLALKVRDRPRLEESERQLRALGDRDAALRMAQVIAARAGQILNGAAIPTKGLDADRRALASLAFAFDETRRSGRLRAQARALTLATLEQRAGHPARAAELLREARRFGGELAPLAAGLAQLLIDDVAGAGELCARGTALDVSVRQLLQICRALGEAGAAARAAWREVDALWDGAGLVPVLQSGTARPLFVPDFTLQVQLAPGEPLTVVADLEPVVLLVPELAPDRGEVRRRAGR